MNLFVGFNLNLGDIYAILTAICWSSAVILFDLSSRRLSSLQVNILKNIIGVFGFLITLQFIESSFQKCSIDDFVLLIISGLLGVAIGDLMFLASLRRLGSGLTAIVGTSYSPAVFLFSLLMFQEAISIQSYFGGILVILGIIVGTFKTSHFGKKDILKGVFFGIGAQALTAYSVLIVRPMMDSYSIIFIALVRFSTGFILSSFFLWISEGYNSFINTIKLGIRNPYLVSGAFLGTYLSVIFWLLGFKYTLAGRAAIYNQLSTILIILMAAIFLKEPMTKRKWIAVSLAIFGALIVSSI